MIKRGNPLNPRSYRYRLRKRRFVIVERMIRALAEVKSTVRILDVGGRLGYWRMLAPDLRGAVHLVILNREAEFAWLDEADPSFSFEKRVGDGCDLQAYVDGEFDLVHSNSVIEHVGSLQKMKRFAEETRRVGNGYYVQTPYLWFPMEPHYLVPCVHWLPAPTRVKLIWKYQLVCGKNPVDFTTALVEVDHTQLLDMTMMRSFFPDGKLACERYTFMIKSISSYRDPCLPHDAKPIFDSANC
jgi:hypothetical protein